MAGYAREEDVHPPSGLARNALVLYWAHLVNYLLPLVVVPYLTRVLGAAEWGRLAMALAMGIYIGSAIEYGFHLSGTREVARSRGDRTHLADLAAGVLGARVILAVAFLPVPLAGGRLPILGEHPALLWGAYLWGVAHGFSFGWYLMGMERMRQAALLDTGTRVLATVGIFALVRAPADAPLVLLLQAAGGLLAFGGGWALSRRDLPARRPGWRVSLAALRMGWAVFVFRAAAGLYTAGGAFILGLFAPAHVVGYYAGAEKIGRAVSGLLNPAGQALFPRVSRLVRGARTEALRVVRLGLAAMGLGGALLGLVTFLAAPVLVRILLGPGFQPAVAVLRVLALVAPLAAAGNVLGIQWMLPLGLDRQFVRIVVCAGLLNVGLAVWLAPTLGAVGMAWAVVGAEAAAAAGMWLFLRVGRLDPFKG